MSIKSGEVLSDTLPKLSLEPTGDATTAVEDPRDTLQPFTWNIISATEETQSNADAINDDNVSMETSEPNAVNNDDSISSVAGENMVTIKDCATLDQPNQNNPSALGSPNLNSLNVDPNIITLTDSPRVISVTDSPNIISVKRHHTLTLDSSTEVIDWDESSSPITLADSPNVITLDKSVDVVEVENSPEEDNGSVELDQSLETIHLDQSHDIIRLDSPKVANSGICHSTNVQRVKEDSEERFNNVQKPSGIDVVEAPRPQSVDLPKEIKVTQPPPPPLRTNSTMGCRRDSVELDTIIIPRETSTCRCDSLDLCQECRAFQVRRDWLSGIFFLISSIRQNINS